MRKVTPQQGAEAELTVSGLAAPETTAGPGWGEQPDELTMIVKLPISAGMVQDLYFVRESKGWFKQHNWVIAHFDADDDILAELPTLKGWLTQSYCAVAPKKLGRLVRGEG